MYNTKNILYLISSLSAIEKITLYTKGLDTAIALLAANDQMNFNASNSLLIAIAEEIKKTDPQLLQTKPSIQWKNIADMRNILAHDYRGIDPEVVFDVIKNELPQLKKALLELLKLLPQNLVQVVLATKQYQHLQQVINH